jgi:hypothetical protein
MPALFDPNDAKSTEAIALWQLAERLSECEQYIELSEMPDAETAFEKIIIGPFQDRMESEEYTPDELASDFFYCAIAPQEDEAHEAARPETLTECPNEGGRIEIYFRRHVREGELKEGSDGRRDVYLFFLDRIGAIKHQLFERAQVIGAPRIVRIRRVLGPKFADIASEVAQGCYIWASIVVEWGDLDLSS